jgi:hypothetical protein
MIEMNRLDYFSPPDSAIDALCRLLGPEATGTYARTEGDAICDAGVMYRDRVYRIRQDHPDLYAIHWCNCSNEFCAGFCQCDAAHTVADLAAIIERTA